MSKRIRNIFFSMFASLSIFVNIELFLNVSNLDLKQFYNVNVLLMTIVFVICFYIFNKLEKSNLTKFQKFLCLVFSLCMIIGECYITYGSINLILKNVPCFVFSIIKLIGYIYLFN